MHGVKHHCSTCQSLSGRVQPLGAWSLRPGFHPHCDCTLDYIGFYTLVKDEPTVFISVLAFPIAQYWDGMNPIKSTNPIAFPLCAFLANNGIAAGSPYTIVPMAAAFTADLVIPLPVEPPSESRKQPARNDDGSIVDTSNLKQAPRFDPNGKSHYEAT